MKYLRALKKISKSALVVWQQLCCVLCSESLVVLDVWCC